MIQKHIHKYKRVPHKTRKDLYMCSDSNCTHRTNKVFLRGKLSRCSFCNSEFELDENQLKNKEPRCFDCKQQSPNPKAGNKLVLDSVLSDILDSFGGEA